MKTVWCLKKQCWNDFGFLTKKERGQSWQKDWLSPRISPILFSTHFSLQHHLNCLSFPCLCNFSSLKERHTSFKQLVNYKVLYSENKCSWWNKLGTRFLQLPFGPGTISCTFIIVQLYTASGFCVFVLWFFDKSPDS